MKIAVTVKAGAKVVSVEEAANGGYLVKVKAPAQDGKANEALVEALSEYFRVPKSRISIERGHGSKNKIVEIV